MRTVLRQERRSELVAASIYPIYLRWRNWVFLCRIFRWAILRGGQTSEKFIHLSLLCLSLVACANEADRWQLLETEHFYIAYEKENVAELQKVGDLAEDIHKRLTAIFPSKLSGKPTLCSAIGTMKAMVLLS